MDGDAESPIRPGESFGDFDVLEEIGSGAFAVVYRAHNNLLDRMVALKVLDSSHWPDHHVARDEILKEARMVARIIDPHVVTLYQALALPNEQWAFELEYLGGGSLRDRLNREGPLDPAEARRILVAVLSGLDAAHQQGIVHHDIKPGNVLLGKDGAVKLADFGLGRFVAEDGLSSAPRGHIRGTPHYMAPEVVMGRPAEKASDLWSVGVLLFRMLAGRVPFPARTVESLFVAIQNATPLPLPANAPEQLAGIALRCMAKRPEERPASAATLIEELAHHGRIVGGVVTDPAIAGGPSTILTGRERELAVLRARLDETGKGHGGAVLVLGEAGIGKTALMQAFGREARARNFRWIEVRLSPLEGLRRPLAQALHDTLSNAKDLSDPSTDQREPSSSSSRGLEVLRRLIDEGTDGAAELPLQSSWEIEQALVALSASRPVALLLEDIHLCDRDELKMLATLGPALSKAPVFLALTYRTSDPSASDSTEGPPAGYYELSAAAEIERLELEPLGDRAIRALLEQESGLPALPLPLVERVIRDSDGIPLYALELFRHLEASGEIERGQDTIRITKRWGKADLPRALRDMVRRRLAGIGEEERAILETAAVAGVEFDGARLAEVLDVPLLRVLRTLQRLYRERALVAPLEKGYRFAHALYQEAIYKETAPDLRRALHRAWAEVLEPESSETSVDPEALGWHWEQAGVPEKAGGLLLLAARAATRRGEHSRAWQLAERGGALDAGATPEELRTNLPLLESLYATFTSEAEARVVEALHERLLQAAEALGDDEMRLQTIVAQSWHRKLRAGGAPLDLAALETAAARLPDGKSRADAWWLLGRIRAETGDHAEARVALEQATRIYTACGREGSTAQPLHTLGSILRQECEFEAAETALTRCADTLRRAQGDSVHSAISSALATVSGCQAGRVAGAGDAMDPWIRLLERSDQVAHACHVAYFQALLYEAEGRVADARATLRRIEPTLREAVLAQALWSSLRLKARLQIAAGELEAAEATIRDAEAARDDLGPIDLISLDEQRAFLETVRGEHDAARRRILAALDLVAPTVHLQDLSRLLVQMIQLSALGLDLSAAVPTLRGLAERQGTRPPALDLPVRIAETALRTDLREGDAGSIERAAALARDPRVGWHQATLGAVASLLSARANLLSGERRAAAALLLDARQRGQHLANVWLELRALQLARDADLDVDPIRVRALVDLLKARNPADADRTAGLIAAWTSGMPRA